MILREGVLIVLSSEEIVGNFKIENKSRIIDTFDIWIQDIDPSKIIGINFPYSYPDILEDYKMKKLKNKISSKQDWDMCAKKAMTLEILKFPNGDLIVNGNGNHRAVLAKELGMKSIKAKVKEVRFLV